MGARWIAVLGFSTCCIWPAAAAAHDPLIDEVIAGAEANSAEIRAGVATYDWRSTQEAALNRENRATIVVKFDGDKTQMDDGSIRMIVADERYVSVGSNLNPVSKYTEPSDFDVIIRERQFAPSFPVHPKYQGLDSCRWTVASELRGVMNNSDFVLSASKEGDIIHVTEKASTFRKEYDVDSTKGYVPVRYRVWNLPNDDSPVTEVVSELQQIESGAFVIKHFKCTKLLLRLPHEVVDRITTDATLVEYSPALPDGQVFTLDGLGLVVGARVQDRINGREYRFGIEPFDEGIDLPGLRGASGRRWLLGINALIVVVLLGWWVVSYVRRRAVS